jgi:hypothetical protein
LDDNPTQSPKTAYDGGCHQKQEESTKFFEVIDLEIVGNLSLDCNTELNNKQRGTYSRSDDQGKLEASFINCNALAMHVLSI